MEMAFISSTCTMLTLAVFSFLVHLNFLKSFFLTLLVYSVILLLGHFDVIYFYDAIIGGAMSLAFSLYVLMEVCMILKDAHTFDILPSQCGFAVLAIYMDIFKPIYALRCRGR